MLKTDNKRMDIVKVREGGALVSKEVPKVLVIVSPTIYGPNAIVFCIEKYLVVLV